MNITLSEVFRIQQICDNLGSIVKIAEEGRKKELEDFEVIKCINIIENCGEEFYMISENIMDRHLSEESENVRA